MGGFRWMQADMVQADMVQSSGDLTVAPSRKPTWLLEIASPKPGSVGPAGFRSVLRFLGMGSGAAPTFVLGQNPWATLDLPLDVQYGGVILACSGIERQLVDVFWGLQEIREVTLTLANPHGRFTADYVSDLRGVAFRLRRYDWGSGIASAQLLGVWTQATLDVGTLTLRGADLDLSIFEQEIPKGVVTVADWPNALDLGEPLPIVIGNVARVPGLLVNYDAVNGLTDVLFSRGRVTILQVFRNVGEFQSPVAPTEYTQSTTLYPGFTVIRFPLLQRDFQNAPHRFWADVAGLQPERNAARFIETILTDPTWGLSQLVDTAAFGAAAVAVGVVEMEFAGVVREPTQAQNLLRDLLLTRGMRLGLNADGKWTITVDRLRSGVVLALGDGPVDGPRNLLAARTRERPALEDMVSALVLRYRPDFGGDGVLLMEARRALSTRGHERLIEHRYIRDRETADRVADYHGKRLTSRESVEVEASQAAQGLLEGDLVSLTYEPLGYAGETVEVSRSEVLVDLVRATLNARDAGVYTYTPGTLPTEDLRGTFDDWTRTPPNPATNLSVASSGPELGADGTTLAFVVLQFDTPAVNYSESRISFRTTGTAAWNYNARATSLAGTGVQVKLSGLIPGLSYDFTVETVNAPGNLTSLTGPLLLNQLAPGDVTAPATPATPTIANQQLSVMSFAWAAVADPDVLTYEWDVRTAADGGGSLVDAGSTPGAGPVLTHDFQSLSYNVARHFRVRALDRSGNRSAYSSSVSFTMTPAVSADYSALSVKTGKLDDLAVTTGKRSLLGVDSSTGNTVPANGAITITFTHNLGVTPIVIVFGGATTDALNRFLHVSNKDVTTTTYVVRLANSDATDLTSVGVFVGFW